MRYHEENAVTAVQLLTRDLESEPRSAEERERVLFHLSRHCRIAALAGLLGRADVGAFHERLRQSGTWRLRMLRERATQARPFSRFTGAAQIAPLCDALAAGDEPLARDIAVASAPEWVARKEFEDDFFYGRLLCGFVAGGLPAGATTDDLMAGLIRSTEDETAPRVRVCQALLTRDSEAFLAALLELLERHGAWYQARTGTMLAREPAFELERSVCMEGLALLQLAAKHGLSLDLDAEYPFVPSIARPGIPPA
ncbi:immunity 49 family protein [Pyxidicoccus parkwayensis]|uniref:Immunity 49 family protein n=1 Tax=Pyxidicoccus parkwayensis TaxID=2813578 RepID=A0ABX7NQP3_9BACT|nr:Imm49 family immunity protein [Pyxidicoccus parkwaysis]QSQ20743.1 immunity 49 family protein [Pyxidicoccus parkwaysis]